MTSASDDSHASEIDVTTTSPTAHMQMAAWWDFALEEDVLVREVERWENVPTPTARDLEAREAGLARARGALSEFRAGRADFEREHVTVRPVPTEATAAPPANLADLFDDVTVPELETMFPARGKWARWAERASDNGLKVARRGRGRFNPYIAAEWFRAQKLPGWDRARLDRVLASNLPVRSHHMGSYLVP